MTDENVNVAEFDFGITRLAGEFHQDWRNYAETPGGLVHTWISELGVSRVKKVSLLFDDVQRMLGAALSGASLEVLWNACVPSECLVEIFGGDGRGWLLQVSDIARCWLVEHSDFDPETLPDCRHEPLPDLVRHWIEEATSAGGLVRRGGSGAEFFAAWDEIAENSCPELALRIALRSLLSSGHSIPAHVYGEMERQGAIYGYGDFLVSAVDHLIDGEMTEIRGQEF
jgi:hypothetical protein